MQFKDLRGLWAAPLDHPVTCANPMPWKIIDVKFALMGLCEPLKVWVRGEGSMWFRADQCYIDERQNEVQMFVDLKAKQEEEASSQRGVELLMNFI